MTNEGHIAQRPPAVGSRYYFPAIDWHLPLAACPGGDGLEAQAAGWAKPWLVRYFGSEERADAYLSHRPVYWSTVCFPGILSQLAPAIANHNWAVLLLDDAFSMPRVCSDSAAARRLADGYLAALDGVRPDPRQPELELFYESMVLLWRQMPSGLSRRFTAGLRDIVNSSARQQRDHNAETVTDLAAYTAIRRSNVFGFWSTMFTEHSLGLDLTPELQELSGDRDLVHARDLATDSLFLVNDLFSYSKELSAGESLNILWIFMRDGMSLQGAVDHLALLIGDNQRQFIDACAQVRRSPLGARADIDAYLTALGHLMAGNLHFHRISKRYHGLDYQWDGTTNGWTDIKHVPPISVRRAS